MPAWAYMDVVTPDLFNKTAAQQLAAQDKPDSLAPDTPQSTAPFISSFTPTGSATLTDGGPSGKPTAGGAQTSGQKDKTNVGAIVGGVVGGVGGLLVIGALLFWLLRRKRSASPDQPAMSQPESNPVVTPQIWSPTPAPAPSNPFVSPTPSFAPTSQEMSESLRPYVRSFICVAATTHVLCRIQKIPPHSQRALGHRALATHLCRLTVLSPCILRSQGVTAACLSCKGRSISFVPRTPHPFRRACMIRSRRCTWVASFYVSPTYTLFVNHCRSLLFSIVLLRTHGYTPCIFERKRGPMSMFGALSLLTTLRSQ